MLYSWKMVLKRRKMTLYDYVYRTGASSAEELALRLADIGANSPSEEDLTKLATAPKPSSISDEVWKSFTDIFNPPVQPKTAKKITSNPEVKNVRKRSPRKSSTSKKVRSSS